MSSDSATAWYSTRGKPMGRPINAPRCSSPLSFLARVPYTLALMATVIGLWLSFGSMCTVDGALVHAHSRRLQDADPALALEFTQVVDHFNSLDGRTFHQRYWEDQRWWKVSSDQTNAKTYPLALLKINSFHSDASWNSSTITAWAKELGAVVYELEPRYAGKSYPLPDVSTGDLRFYSIEQVVADVVSFISNRTTLLPNATRWIVMGELFDGAFATWVRAKPRIAFGSVAVSPHLLALEGYTDYDRAYGAALGTRCAEVVHDLMGLVTWTLERGTDPNQAFQRACGSEEVLPDGEFMYVLSTILFANMDDQHPKLCATFGAVADADNATRLATLANYTVAFNREMGMKFVDWDFARDTGEAENSTGAGFRPTYYLKCAQLGQFEVAGAGPTSLMPPQRNLEWYLSVCRKLFPNITTDRPNVDSVNANYGGRAPEGCNMAFVTAKHDPYFSLGPDPAVIKANAKTSGNKIIPIECASPQAGFSLFSPALPTDPACLRRARDAVFATLRAWQTQPDTCPTNTAGGGGGGKHGDGDMALVGVFSAVGGIVLGVAVAGGVFVYASRAVIRKWKSSAYKHVN